MAKFYIGEACPWEPESICIFDYGSFICPQFDGLLLDPKKMVLKYLPNKCYTVCLPVILKRISSSIQTLKALLIFMTLYGYSFDLSLGLCQTQNI